MTQESDQTSEDYLFKVRDRAETERLNLQHTLVLDVCSGNLVHPLIPIKDCQAVADIATGTGVWLEELASQQSNTKFTRLDGFDISAAQFPPENKRAGNYVLHDLIKPFPKEYHNSYDFVHVRYLIVAIKAEQFEVAAKHLFEILKPGGYIQWDELDFERFLWHGNLKYSQELYKTVQGFYDCINTLGFSAQASTFLQPVLQAATFVDLQTDVRNSYWFQNLNEKVITWSLAAFGQSLPGTLVFSGKAKDIEEAKKLLPEYIARFKKEYLENGPPNMAHVIVVGRKPPAA